MSHSLSSGTGSKFRVAICGAGIGGLVLAITLGKYAPSIPIDIYEAHGSIDTPGVGITLWSQVHEVLVDLGVFDEIKPFFTNYEGGCRHIIRRSDIPEGGYIWYQRPKPPTSMHRQHMVAVLVKHLPASCTVYLNRRLVNYTEVEQQDAHSTSHIRLDFTDGTTATTDILIGADGIRSAVRKAMFETAASQNNADEETGLRDYIDATFTGMVTHRFLVSAEVLRKHSPENRSFKELIIYCGKGRYIITYPIAQGTLINAMATITDRSMMGTHYGGRWVTDADRDDVVGRFDDFEPDARAVVELCEKPSRWALHDMKPLPFCVRNRVALIGDASHATTPYYGAGAGQAIDDAFVLGRLIAHPLTTLSQISDVLRIYEEIRLPFAQTVASISLSTGWLYTFMEPGYYDGTRKEEELDENGISAYERDGMEKIRQELLRRWKWVDESKSGVETWKEAEVKLRMLSGQVQN